MNAIRQPRADIVRREAYLEGRAEALAEAVSAVALALGRVEAIGPPPAEAEGVAVILAYEIVVAAASGAAFSDLARRLKDLAEEARDERRLLMDEAGTRLTD